MAHCSLVISVISVHFLASESEVELLASLLEKDGDLYFLQVKGIFQQDPGSVGEKGVPD